jgi:hypothetical protein
MTAAIVVSGILGAAPPQPAQAWPKPLTQLPSSTDAPQTIQLLWREVAPVAGRFSVLMPGEPSETVQPLQTSVGFVELHSILVEDQDNAYLVMYADYPEAAIAQHSPTAILAQVTASWLDEHRVAATEPTNLELSGHPGQGLRYVLPNGLQVQARAYLVGRRLYQIFALYAPPLPASSEPTAENVPPLPNPKVDQFLNSFRLLNTPADRPTDPPADRPADPPADLPADLPADPPADRTVPN